MRHETRDSTDLVFTLEIILGGAGQTTSILGNPPEIISAILKKEIEKLNKVIELQQKTIEHDKKFMI